MSRSLGGRSLTTRSPMAISPAVISSSPATMRSVVDLPQPDGPTRTMNSLSRICRFTSLTACTSSYFLLRSFSSTWAIAHSPSHGFPGVGGSGHCLGGGVPPPPPECSTLRELGVNRLDLLLAPLHRGLQVEPVDAVLGQGVDHHELLRKGRHCFGYSSSVVSALHGAG